MIERSVCCLNAEITVRSNVKHKPVVVIRVKSRLRKVRVQVGVGPNEGSKADVVAAAIMAEMH